MSSFLKKVVNKDDSGEVMIESMLVMIPTLFVVVYLISLGFLLYQSFNMQYVADSIASNVAVNYQYGDVEIRADDIAKDSITARPIYKYTKHGDELLSTNKSKGKTYGNKLLKLTSFGKSMADPVITIRVEDDSLARRHVEVKLTGRYKIPFSEGLEIMGMDGIREYECYSSAECIDMSDVVSTVKFSSNIVTLATKDSKTISGINYVIKCVQDIRKLVLEIKQ